MISANYGANTVSNQYNQIQSVGLNEQPLLAKDKTPVVSGENVPLNFFSSAQDTMLTLGKSVLGKDNIADWQAKGLKVDDKAIELAYEQMSLGLQELGGKAGKVSFNPHQIVKSVQDVPQWFHDEQQDYIDSIQDPVVRERFQQGDLFASTVAVNPSNQRSMDSYLAVYNS